MIRVSLLLLLLVLGCRSFGQELYVFTEPASNMPSRSVGVRLTGCFPFTNSFRQRYVPEIMVGFSKYLMLHVSGTFSDYYSNQLQAESGRIYAKYRFYSHEDIHRHFRMAAFGDIAFSRSPYLYEDASLDGDNSGFQAGLIITQLVKKLAISSTLAYTRLSVVGADKLFISNPSYHLFNYSLSAGYLILPKEYASYKQLNVNIYTEIVGVKSFDNNSYNIDLAPAMQFIFNSNSKINIGCRFQLSGNMSRIANNTFLVAFEHTLFNVWK